VKFLGHPGKQSFPFHFSDFAHLFFFCGFPGKLGAAATWNMNQHRKSSKVLGDDLIRILEDVTQGYAPGSVLVLVWSKPALGNV